MVNTDRVWIVSGRFQPFHGGHLAVARSACAAMPWDSTLVLAVVAPLKGLPDTPNEFASIAEEHHSPDRNPWSITTRLMALVRVVQALSVDYPETSVVASAIPRPDLGWETLVSWFPGERTWVVPDAQEDFDNAKVDYFLENGDAVVRFKDETNVDGRLIRSRFASDPEAASLLLPEVVRQTYLAGWRA